MSSADGEFTPPRMSGLLPAWKAGQSGNPAGRPLGSRQRLTERFLADLQSTWEAGGIEALKAVQANDPSAYCRIIASLVPKQSAHLRANVTTRPLEEINSDLRNAVRAMGFVMTPLTNDGDRN